MSPISKFCSECGAPLEEGARFCGECGAAISDMQDSAENKATSTTPPPPPPQSQRYEEQPKKPKPQTRSAQHAPLKIIPLLYWSAVWGIGWLLVTGIFNLFLIYSDPYSDQLFWYVRIDWIISSIVAGLIGGFIAGIIVQWTGISKKPPTLKLFAILLFMWGIFGGSLWFVPFNPFYLVDLFDQLLPMTFSALIGWIVLIQTEKSEKVSFSRSTRIKMLIGWALCGLITITLVQYIPSRLISLVIF